MPSTKGPVRSGSDLIRLADTEAKISLLNLGVGGADMTGTQIAAYLSFIKLARQWLINASAMQITATPSVLLPAFQPTSSRSTGAGHTSDASNAPSTTDDVSTYDFTNMTPREMLGAMNDLIKRGKLSLDESTPLMMKVGQYLSPLSAAGSTVTELSNEPVNFINALQTDIKNMEETGDAKRPDSGYKYWKIALDKLEEIQDSASGLNTFA